MKRTSILATLAAAAVLSAPLVALAQTGSATPASKPAAAAPAAKQMSTSTAKPVKAHKAKVDLNEATKDDLMKLKGMTDADADKIIAARPFTNVSDLKTKKILTAAQYSKVRGWVMVKKEKVETTKK